MADADAGQEVEPLADEAAPSVVELDGITKRFGTETAIDDLSLTVHDGELLTLLGPSGCGKTTTLRLLAGLDRPTAGTIRINGEVVADADRNIPPDERNVGIVFQEFALFPHLSVEDNIAFGIRDQPAAVNDRVAELLELVGLEGYGARSVDQLSGGERQRVALARSLAPEPAILLLDEPFSNLDIRLRVEMREEVRRILKEAGVTAVSVTHDQEEALSISDRVAVMNAGNIEQVGTPEALFEDPRSRFVAGFLGQASFLSARIDNGEVRTAIGTFDDDLLKGLSTEYDGADVDVLVRPDDLRARSAPREAANGVIVHRQYTGPTFVYRVELGNGDVVHCLHSHETSMAIDEPVLVELAADHSLAWYPAR